jgi:hypothetical protein
MPSKKENDRSNENVGVSDSLANEARALGIEPATFGDDAEALQERVDHVRAEKEAVGGDTDIDAARAEQREQREASRKEDATQTNLSQATDAEADQLKSK